MPRDNTLDRIRFENPWWRPPHKIHDYCANMTPRAYLEIFSKVLSASKSRRAVVLMGPRRVGKTVLLYHSIAQVLASGVPPNRIGYVSVEHPLYNGLGLEELATAAMEAAGVASLEDVAYLFFDEIQYMRDWEVHLKSFVDSHRNVQVGVSGSAAAALRLKSTESGAGRFTEFMLPPLTFYEFVEITGQGALVEEATPAEPGAWRFRCEDVGPLNRCFIDYVNFGGYPELALDEEVRRDPGRFIRSDIIDKVLLKDLPGLYGIQDIQELNSLFTTLAFNTANEVSLETLSTKSGVAKNTLKRYIEYLEAAFLIRRLSRIDKQAKRFRRAWSFKVYLTNPSMWGALFSPVTADSEGVGYLAESAVLAQWFHTVFGSNLRYARWDSGEVDIVGTTPRGKPTWVVEVKWSDHAGNDPRDLRQLVGFCRAHDIREALVTTRTVEREIEIEGVRVRFRPTSLYCYVLGRNAIAGRSMSQMTDDATE